MSTYYIAGEHLDPSQRSAIAHSLPPGTFATIMGSATFGGFHPGKSDVDVIRWETSAVADMPPVLADCSAVRMTRVDAALAGLDPGFGRILEAHYLICAGRLDVLGDIAASVNLAIPTRSQLYERRQLELQMVIGWISKESGDPTSGAQWFAHRKLVLRATKIEARLRGIDLYANSEAEDRASARAPMRPSNDFLATHLEWLRASLIELVT